MEMTSILTIPLTVLGGYMVTSAFFFRYPSLLHKKKKVHFIAKHISHRGGAGEYFENTLGACERAKALGTDMLEIDCQLTKDEKVVVCHDQNLLRLTGMNVNVSDLLYHELPRISSSVPIDFIPGLCYKNEDEDVDRKIPLLEEMLRNFKGTPFNIDVKENTQVMISEISRLVKEFDMENLVVWGDAQARFADMCSKENPNIGLFFSRKRFLTILVYYYIGLLPFVSIKETHLEICVPSIYEQFPHEKNRFGPFTTVFFRFLDFLVIRKSLFTHLRNRGIQVYLWVLNDEKQFEKAFKVGATGVITDFPSKLSTFLRNNRHVVE